MTEQQKNISIGQYKEKLKDVQNKLESVQITYERRYLDKCEEMRNLKEHYEAALAEKDRMIERSIAIEVVYGDDFNTMIKCLLDNGYRVELYQPYDDLGRITIDIIKKDGE